MSYIYIYHPVNNHQYLAFPCTEFNDEYFFRGKNFADKNMALLAKIEQTTIRRPAIIDWDCFENTTTEE